MSRRGRRASTSRHASLHRTQGGGASADASSSEPDSSEELVLMGKQLRRVGLAIRDVRRDGNCLFRAVSDQIYGTEDHHAYMRDCTCAFMEEHEERFLPWFVDETQSFAEYVEHMRSDGVWAGHIEIQAVSLVFEVNLRIHQCAKPSYTIHNHPHPDARAIHLFYHYGEHYASVRPLRQLHDLSRAEHQPLPQPHGSGSDSDTATGAGGGGNGTGAGGGASSRRPRRPSEDVMQIWARADESVMDVAMLIEHVEAAARYFRRGVNYDEAAAVLVREIVRETAQASEVIAKVQDQLSAWRGAHAARMARRQRDGLPVGNDTASVSESDSDDSYDSYSDGWNSDAPARDYAVVVRRERLHLYAVLDRAEKRLSVLLTRARELRTMQGSAEVAPADGTVQRTRSRHTSKRREQEERRKQRKSRRRQEQERAARRAAGKSTTAATGYSIGTWAARLD